MSDPADHASEGSKYVIDALSFATVLGTLADMLPSIAAGFSIIWTIIRIYETKTVQAWIKSDDDDD